MNWQYPVTLRYLPMTQGRFTPQLVELIKGLHGDFRGGAVYLHNPSEHVFACHRDSNNFEADGQLLFALRSHFELFIFKLVLDAVFCPQGGDFRNEIIWHYTGRRMVSSKSFNSKHDVIFFYTKSASNPIVEYPSEPWTKEEYIQMKKQEVHTDTDNRQWIWGHAGKGKGHHYKIYLIEVVANGRPVDDVWDIPIINTSSKERQGYPPEAGDALNPHFLFDS